MEIKYATCDSVDPACHLAISDVDIWQRHASHDTAVLAVRLTARSRDIRAPAARIPRPAENRHSSREAFGYYTTS